MNLALRFGVVFTVSSLWAGCSLHTNQEHVPGGVSSTTSSGASSSSVLDPGVGAGVEPGPGGGQGNGTTSQEGGADGPGSSSTCPAGQTRCAGRCVDLSFELAHCGSCGDACSGNHVQAASCLQGRCEGKCSPGFEDCNADLRRDGCETSLRNDVSNCGGCGNACSGAQMRSPSCAQGSCVGECKEGYADCNDNLRDDGCEVNLMRDPQHCGACQDSACAPGSKCKDGKCVLDCAPGEVECAGACVDLRSDVLHCGACNAACSSEGMQSQTCEAGICKGTCAKGREDCNGELRADGCEVDVFADPDNCGGCFSPCSRNNVRTALCSFGRCQSWCEAGFDDCRVDVNDGCETAVHADPNNCGRCGFQCVERGHMLKGATCESGACAGLCEPGYLDCNSDPLDACEAYVWGIENCGGCGIDCADDLHYQRDTAECRKAGPSGSHQCSGQCQAKYGDCDGDQANGCESDLRIDEANCGACGNACADGLLCENERCVSPS